MPRLTTKKAVVAIQNMIYVIRASNTNLVKIGFTESKETLKRRLIALKTSCPFKLKIEASFRGSKLKERCLHGS